MPSESIVTVENLVKVYPGGTRAVDDISFRVEPGELFGFLGPNGAGKTTTIKVLATLLRKTSGRATVAGHDVDREPQRVRASIGFAMQEVGLDDLSKGRDFLELQGLLYGMSRRDARDRASELLEVVGLSDVAGRRVGTYSGGMRRRIDLIGALMHGPRLLFLDEPTTGLDPQSRLAIWDHLEKLNAQGVTMILTTQIMEEADRLCGRIAIIDQGRIVAGGSPAALKAQVGGDVVHLGFEPGADGGAAIQTAARLVRQRPYVTDVTPRDHSLAVTVTDGGAAAPDLMRLLYDKQITVANVSVAHPSLDDVFLKHTGRQIRGEDASGDESNQAIKPWLGVNRG